MRPRARDCWDCSGELWDPNDDVSSSGIKRDSIIRATTHEALRPAYRRITDMSIIMKAPRIRETRVAISYTAR